VETLRLKAHDQIQHRVFSPYPEPQANRPRPIDFLAVAFPAVSLFACPRT